MSRERLLAAALFLVLGLAAGPAPAQETETPPAPAEDKEKAVEQKREAPAVRAPGRPTANLKVQLVLTRLLNDKKIGSLPYTFTVTANGPRTRMRMGLDMPVPLLNSGRDENGRARSYNYKSVGTNMDCIVRDLNDGRYELNMTIENSTALADEKQYPEVAATGAPIFRRFETTLNPVLRDGQSLQTIASTDPVTGEVVKIDLTLSLVK